MTDVTIRQATLDDVDALADLFDGYRRFFENPGDLSGARRLLLATQQTNASAKALYEAHGWQLDETFDHYQRFF